MQGAKYNNAVLDVNEVCQQAIKSIIWVKSKQTLLSKIEERVKRRGTPFIYGDFDSLKRLLRSDRKFEVLEFTIQPGISKSTSMPEKIGEVLAASNFYIANSGRVKELRIWGSE